MYQTLEDYQDTFVYTVHSEKKAQEQKVQEQRVQEQRVQEQKVQEQTETKMQKVQEQTETKMQQKTPKSILKKTIQLEPVTPIYYKPPPLEDDDE